MAFVGIAYPINITLHDSDGIIRDISSATAYRMEAKKEYSTTTPIDGTGVQFLTDGTDGILNGTITFDDSGEWELTCFVTLNAVEFASTPLRIFVRDAP